MFFRWRTYICSQNYFRQKTICWRQHWRAKDRIWKNSLHRKLRKCIPPFPNLFAETDRWSIPDLFSASRLFLCNFPNIIPYIGSFFFSRLRKYLLPERTNVYPGETVCFTFCYLKITTGLEAVLEVARKKIFVSGGFWIFGLWRQSGTEWILPPTSCDWLLVFCLKFARGCLFVQYCYPSS